MVFQNQHKMRLVSMILILVLIGCLASSVQTQQKILHQNHPFYNETEDKKVILGDGHLTIRLEKKVSISKELLREIEKLEKHQTQTIFDQLIDYLLDLYYEKKQEEPSNFVIVDSKQSGKGKKFQLGSNIIYLENNGYNTVYIGPIYMGSQATEMSCVWDTGSDMVTIMGTSCSNCDGDNFDNTASSYSSQVSTTQMTRSYGKGTIDGYRYQDAVYVDSAQTVGGTNFEYMLITYQEDFNSLQGLIGMTRDRAGRLSDQTVAHEPLYVPYLQTQGAISSQIFAFYQSDPSDQSYIQIGTYDTSMMRDSSNLVWIDMLDDYMYWYQLCTGVKIGDSQYRLTGDYKAIFDTGTSLTYLPYSIGQSVINKILAGKRSANLLGFNVVPCDESAFEAVAFFIDGYWIEMKPETYILQLTDKVCVLGFAYSESFDFFLFGGTFLNGYYTIWDMDNDKLGLSPQIKSTVSDIYTGSISSSDPTLSQPNQVFIKYASFVWTAFLTAVTFPIWRLIKIILLIFFLIMTPVFIINFCIKFQVFSQSTAATKLKTPNKKSFQENNAPQIKLIMIQP